MKPNVSDSEWLEMNIDPAAAAPHSLALPGLPPEEIQRQFTGRSGRSNLQQAFAFYSHLRTRYLVGSGAPLIMDFGAGWGRIARFFLRDTDASNIVAVDPYSVAHEWMERTRLPCVRIRSEPLPPIPGLAARGFDLVYSFSVFSHLSEEYFLRWVRYLGTLLAPGGVLVFTTRGRRYLDYVESNRVKPHVFGDYDAIRRRLAEPAVLFFRDRPARAELSGDHYGEAFVTRACVEERLGDFELLEFDDDIPYVPQTVVALRRRG